MPPAPPATPITSTPRRTHRRLAALLLATTAVAAATAGPAAAGTYNWQICVDTQAVGSAAAGDRVRDIADGKPTPPSNGAGPYVTPCVKNNNHNESPAPHDQFTASTLIDAPPQTTITAAYMNTVGNNYSFNNAWGYLVTGATNSWSCSYYENQFPDTLCGGGGAGDFNTQVTRTLALAGAGSTFLQYGIYCRYTLGCTLGTLDLATISLSVDVRDEQAPSVSLGGPAWTDASVKGSPTLSYAATDNAAGTQGIRAFIDGEEKASTIATDSAGCGDRTWHRCPDDSGSVDVPLAAVSDGPHNLTVRAYDSVGNVSSDKTRTITVANRPRSGDKDPTGDFDGDGTINQDDSDDDNDGTADNVDPAPFDAAVPARAGQTSSANRPAAAAPATSPNGQNPTPEARLTALFVKRGRKSSATGVSRYGQAAVIRGKLTTKEGAPIADAALELIHPVLGKDLGMGQARTGPDGSYQFKLSPRIGSRSMIVRYRHDLSRGEVAATRPLRLRVRAALTLNVTRSGESLVFRGQGRMPGRRSGRQVTIEYRVGQRAWKPFITDRTSRTGHYTARFRPAVPLIGRVQFRAVVGSASSYDGTVSTARSVRFTR